jgi:hypothetical protein
MAPKLFVSIPAFAVIPVFALLAARASADVTYEEETRMGGAISAMAAGQPTRSVTRLSGDFMRTDHGDVATITDLGGERIITLDTKRKTYSITTFEKRRQKMEEAFAAAQGRRGGKPPAPGSDLSMTTDVRVSETGRSETIQGVPCQQYLLEMDLTVTSGSEKPSGNLVTLSEMWIAKELPGAAEKNAFERRLAEKLGTATIAQEFADAGAPRPIAGFGDVQKMADEMKKMDGHPMRTVMYFGDVEAARKEASGEVPPGESQGAGGLAELLERMQQNPQAPPEGASLPAMPGGILMKITTETIRISNDPIEPSLFAVPSDFKQVSPR